MKKKRKMEKKEIILNIERYFNKINKLRFKQFNILNKILKFISKKYSI